MGVDHSRWTQGFTARRGPDRWTRWAGTLAAKHRASNRARALTSMIFAASRLAARIVRQRWFGSINIYPTLRLSVRQILAQLPSSSGESLKVLGDECLQPARLLHSSDPRAHQELIHRREWIAPHLAERAREQRQFVQRENSPLGRAFLRVTGPEDFPRGRGHISVAKETVYATTRRIMEYTRRIEERTARSALSTSLVFKQPAPSTLPANGHELPDDSRLAAHLESAISRGFPAVDVNELTDQVMRRIDDRATAWRERMGKI